MKEVALECIMIILLPKCIKTKYLTRIAAVNLCIKSVNQIEYNV
jgi:hypothetical protein